MDASGRENSSDSVAIDTEQSRVKLTKFKVLPPEDDNNQRQQIERQQEKCNQIAICAICLNRNNQKIAAANAAANKQLSISNKMSPIVNSTPTNEPEKREQDATIFANNLLATNSIIGISLDNDNYKTTNSSDLDERNYGESSDDSSGQFRYQNNSTQHQYDRNRQEFQIIWRQLAFEVSDYSRENKQISGALSKLGQLWRLKTSSSARQQLTISREEFEFDYKNPGSVTTLGSVCDPSSARSTPSSNSKRVIFENLNGYVKSGEVSAILGPSGAGKTSLLTAICGRTENYRGSIQLIGGAKRRLRLSIIPQKDYLLDNLTVRESLLFASKILDPNKSSSEHEANISRVVKMLNLIGCLDSDVSKISGGEYKRVSIAQELISQPDILVLDEPTSGLDSLNCKKLIKSLIGLVEASRQGKIKPLAVVMTIHQPDIDVFNMFDHVYCMARGGNVIYDGHPQDAMQTIRDYAQFSPDRMPPELEQAIESSEPVIGNPANMLIEIASEDLYGLRPIENLARVQQKQFEQFYSAACQNTGQCSDAASVEIDINLVTTSTLQLDAKNLETKQHKQQAPPLIKDKRLGAKRNNYTGLFWYHTRLLTQRAFLATLRDPLACIASLVFHLLLPFIMFTVYSRKIGLVAACPLIVREMDMLSMASNKTLTIVEDLQEQLTMSYECSGMFFLTTYSFSMCSTAIAALAFPLSMHVLLKEVRNGWYNMPTYVTAKTIASLPFEIMFPVVSIIILYFILGMPSSYLEWRLWGIALTCAGVAMIGQTIGLIFGALFMDSVQTAVFLGLAASLPQALLSGYTARIKQMPMLLQHLSWLSPFRYSMDLINMFRFGFGMCPCDAQMDEYLRTTEPRFADIPDQMRPLVSYYLRGALGGQETGATETTIVNNATGPMLTTLDGGQQNSTTTTSLMKEGAKRLLGINYDFILNSTERETIISQLESSETDLFKQMADQLTRSFAFGRKIDSCSDAKSQLLVTFEAPEDEELANMLLYLFALLVIMRIILLIIVKLRVGARL